MRQERSESGYVGDILDAIEKIEAFIAGMDYQIFSKDEKTVYAVIRALEIIGEATKNIDKDMRELYPKVPWTSMAGMRDKLIHDYQGVDRQVVWRTATEELTKVKPEIKRILSDYFC